MVVDDRRFTGFQPEAIDFLAELAQNNDRAWFQPRKAEYERLLKEPMEALVAAPRRAHSRARRLPAAGRPEALDLPDLPRHPVRQGQVAVQDAPRRQVPVGRRATGPDAVDAGAHANGGYFHLQPGNDYVGGGMWMADQEPARRLPAGRSSTTRTRPRRARGTRVPRRVRAGREPRDAQARAAGLSGGPPDGRPVPLQGHRLRPTADATTRSARRPCPTSWPTPTRPRRRSSVSWRRSDS